MKRRAAGACVALIIAGAAFGGTAGASNGAHFVDDEMDATNVAGDQTIDDLMVRFAEVGIGDSATVEVSASRVVEYVCAAGGAGVKTSPTSPEPTLDPSLSEDEATVTVGVSGRSSQIVAAMHFHAADAADPATQTSSTERSGLFLGAIALLADPADFCGEAGALYYRVQYRDVSVKDTVNGVDAPGWAGPFDHQEGQAMYAALIPLGTNVSCVADAGSAATATGDASATTDPQAGAVAGGDETVGAEVQCGSLEVGTQDVLP